MPYKFAYLAACLILAVPWAWVFWKRKDLRDEMLWAGFIGMSFASLDFFLTPYYWHPDSLFGLMPKYGVGIESFLFYFLACGIASSIYEYFTRKKLLKIKRSKAHILGVLVPLIAFLTVAAIWPDKAIYEFILLGIFGSILILIIRTDLWRLSLYSGIIFAALYGAAFFFGKTLFPGVVPAIYNLESLLGVYVAGIPIEELLGAFFVGAYWCMAYEYVKGYRLR